MAAARTASSQQYAAWLHGLEETMQREGMAIINCAVEATVPRLRDVDANLDAARQQREAVHARSKRQRLRKDP
jgi:hypothetical protein